MSPLASLMPSPPRRQAGAGSMASLSPRLTIRLGTRRGWRHLVASVATANCCRTPMPTPS
eukprot:9299120-Pyramimonas_sp.AAC.1